MALTSYLFTFKPTPGSPVSNVDQLEFEDSGWLPDDRRFTLKGTCQLSEDRSIDSAFVLRLRRDQVEFSGKILNGDSLVGSYRVSSNRTDSP